MLLPSALTPASLWSANRNPAAQALEPSDITNEAAALVQYVRATVDTTSKGSKAQSEEETFF